MSEKMYPSPSKSTHAIDPLQKLALGVDPTLVRIAGALPSFGCRRPRGDGG